MSIPNLLAISRLILTPVAMALILAIGKGPCQLKQCHSVGAGYVTEELNPLTLVRAKRATFRAFVAIVALEK